MPEGKCENEQPIESECEKPSADVPQDAQDEVPDNGAPQAPTDINTTNAHGNIILTDYHGYIIITHVNDDIIRTTS